MNLRKFIVSIGSIITILCNCNYASACGADDWETPYSSDPFQVIVELPDSDVGKNHSYNETIDFWYDYAKGNVDKQEIKDFFDNATYNNFQAVNNKFINYLIDTADKNSLTYISNCLELDMLIDDYMGNLWDYDTPDTSRIKEFIKRIDHVSAGKELKPRYEFLKIRSYGAIKDDEGVMKVWNKNKKMEPSKLRDRMQGYVGGVLYRQGNYAEAYDYFAKVSDLNSMQWCIEKLSGLDNIVKVYEYNPNSIVLPIALQDYINYIISASQGGRIFKGKAPYFSDNINSVDLKNDILEMQEFCKKVLTEDRTDNPQLWATALGVLQNIAGNEAEGLKTLQNAKNYKGNDLTEKNLDNFLLWAYLLNSGKNDLNIDNDFAEIFGRKYQEEKKAFVSKYKDYSKKAVKERRDYYAPKANHDTHFFMTFLKKEIAEHFKSINKPEASVGFLAMYEDIPQLGWNSTYYDLLSYLDNDVQLNNLISITNDVNNGNLKNNGIESVYKDYLVKNKNLLNDVAGTRLMRKGKFEEALPYLSELDPKWIVTQPIAPYLRNKDISYKYYDFKRHDTKEGTNSIANLHNYKADFCGNVIAAIDDYNTATGDEKAKKALDLVALCHYATPLGDGWALSDYSWSGEDQRNEFTDMMKEWIAKALANSTSDATKNIAYYALLTIPDHKVNSSYGDYSWYKYPINYTGEKKNVKYFLDSPTPEQLQGLKFLASHWKNFDNPYYITSCDVLKSYTANNFISKPQYY